MNINAMLSAEFQVEASILENIIALIDEGNTIPFIARYRKEKTGAMDDQKLREISERLEYLRGLVKRREAIEKSIDEQGKMTDELRALGSAEIVASLLMLISRCPHNCRIRFLTAVIVSTRDTP